MIAGVEENVRFLNKLSEDHLNGRLAGLFGLHASLTLSEKTLEYCVKNAFPNIGFHTVSYTHLTLPTIYPV